MLGEVSSFDDVDKDGSRETVKEKGVRQHKGVGQSQTDRAASRDWSVRRANIWRSGQLPPRERLKLGGIGILAKPLQKTSSFGCGELKIAEVSRCARHAGRN